MDVEVQKKRFKLFAAINVVMAIIVFAGFYAEFGLHIALARPVWILALLVGFGAQVWFIMGFKRAMSEKGS